MFRRIYQLRNMINIWVDEVLKDLKVQVIRLKDNKWLLVLFVNNMLCSFYKLILIVFRTTNVNMHLEFWLFNALFNYFNVVKKVIRNNAYFSKTLVIKACELTFTKLAKYYFKIKNKDELIYNLVIILDFI